MSLVNRLDLLHCLVKDHLILVVTIVKVKSDFESNLVHIKHDFHAKLTV